MPEEFIEYGLYYHGGRDRLYISFGTSKNGLEKPERIMERLYVSRDTKTKEIIEIRIDDYVKLRWRNDFRPFLWIEENLGIKSKELHKRAWKLVEERREKKCHG